MRYIDENNQEVIVKGILCRYSDDLEFTTDEQFPDLVYYGGLLYVVNENVKGIKPDEDTSGIYTEYSDQLKLSDPSTWDDPDNQDKVVNIDTLIYILNRYMNGIQYNGSIKTLNFTSSVNLDSYLEPCVYKLKFASGSLPVRTIENITECLFMAYRTDNEVVQQILDYKTPSIHFRLLSFDGTVRRDWMCISSSSHETFSNFVNTLTNYGNVMSQKKAQVEEYVRRIESGNYHSYEDATDIYLKSGVAVVPQNVGPVVKLGYSYTYVINGQTLTNCQGFADIDLSLGGTILMGKVRFDVITSGNNFRVTISPLTATNPKINKVLITKLAFTDE